MAGAAQRVMLSQQDMDCRVQVFGYPSYTQPQDLSRAFVECGHTRVTRMTAQHATLVFPTAYDAKNALQASEKVSIYGNLLTVKPFDPSLPVERSRPKREKRQHQISPTLDPKLINLTGDFHSQLDNLLSLVRLSQEEVTAVTGLYTDVEQVLQSLWPGCTAVPFGSIPTGLGIKSSDADCLVLVPPRFRHQSANHVLRAKRALLQKPRLFANVIAIPRANTPIVKFLHNPTNTHCDLSFKTELGSRNSRLLAFLLHTDPRILPIAVVFKYWARVHQLSGSGKLTNYALTMLVVFYLQQLSILPSVQWLQTNVPEDIIDHWNVAFEARREKLPKVDNRSSIMELIGGFFKYYSEFKFDQLIVCPYLGRTVEKKSFENLDNLPPGFERYRSNVKQELVFPLRFNSSICVQDPFEQCHNVATMVSSKLAEDIKAFLKFAADAYEQEKPNRCKRFFPIILFEKPKTIKQRGMPEFRSTLSPNTIANIDAPDWKDVVRKIVLEIFENMLMIKLAKLTEKEKVNQESKKEKEKYTGKVEKAIWKRKPFMRLYNVPNWDIVERNRKITQEILVAQKQLYDLNFQLTITFRQQPPSSVISIKMSSGDIEPYIEFGRFFISVLHQWFAALVKPYSRHRGKDAAAKIPQTINNANEDSSSSSSSDDDVENVDDERASGSGQISPPESKTSLPLPRPAP